MFYSAHKAQSHIRTTPSQSRYLQRPVSIPLQPSPSQRTIPLPITFFSTTHSPKTVNKNASEFVIGTVRLNSAIGRNISINTSLPLYKNTNTNSPAFPTTKKNHTLPVRFSTKGRAYRQSLNKSITPNAAPSTFFLTQLLVTAGEERIGCGGGTCRRAPRRMKGVVKPQARPMRRYARMKDASEGEGVEPEGEGVDDGDGDVDIV